MRPGLARFHAGVVNASRVLSWAGVCALLLVCGAVLADVAMRWAFNRPLHGLEDVTGLVITAAVAACFPAGFALRRHITVRALGTMLGSRTQACLDAFGQAFACALIGLMAWQMMVHVGDVASRKSLILGLPIAPAWSVAAAFIVLAALVQALVLATELAGAWRGRPAAPRQDGAA